MSKSPVVFVLGPTASGKSAVAEHLATRFGGEIVSVDSAQVFRGMDIGTAKPSLATRAAIAHHLIDIRDPVQAYSAGDFVRDATAAISTIASRGKLPILAGGTMLYANALVNGIGDLPPADMAIRSALEAEASAKGWPALHTELARVDPTTAARLEPNDQQRIERALEVFRATGVPISAWQQREGNGPLANPHLLVALVPSDRAVLHQRIAIRFQRMLTAGMEQETRTLLQYFPLTADMPSMRCVGYRQMLAYLGGEYDRATMIEKGIAATRQLAKRQLTWLRSMENLTEFDCLRGDLQDAVAERVAAFLSTH